MKSRTDALTTKGITHILDEAILSAKAHLTRVENDMSKNIATKSNYTAAKEAYEHAKSLRPNEPLDSVPIGNSKNSNVIQKEYGQKRTFDFTIKSYEEMFKRVTLDSIISAMSMSGPSFVMHVSSNAKLHRVLMSFTLDIALQNKCIEVSPPLLVKEEALFRSARYQEMQHKLFTTSGYTLIPTAEVPLVNLTLRGLFEEEELPIRYASCTPCFIKHNHIPNSSLELYQSYSTDVVSITTGTYSEDELETITRMAESILEKLELPYRRVLLCTGETEFAAAKTYDIEVWLPSQNDYIKISRCSSFTDFQAKRLKAKFKATSDKRVKQPVHTVSGNIANIWTLLIALLENLQGIDGVIKVPEILRNYL